MAIGVRTYRPAVAGNTHMVSAGHYLAAASGFRILEQGGNATDAGVAAGIAINVVLPQWTSFGGVAPIIIHDAGRKETVSISGLGRWPAAASIDYFDRRHGGDLPPGVLRTVTPAAADAWLTALRLYGTMSFEQVVTPALEIADQGFSGARQPAFSAGPLWRPPCRRLHRRRPVALNRRDILPGRSALADRRHSGTEETWPAPSGGS